jgi:hypothetical protein
MALDLGPTTPDLSKSEGDVMIQISLGKKKPVDPNTDSLHRSEVGWCEGLPERQLYEIARGGWVMGRRAERQRYAIVCAGGIARQAIEIHRVFDVGGGRRAFDGRVLQSGDPVHDRYVGKPAPNGTQQNPITYFEPTTDDR